MQREANMSTRLNQFISVTLLELSHPRGWLLQRNSRTWGMLRYCYWNLHPSRWQIIRQWKFCDFNVKIWFHDVDLQPPKMSVNIHNISNGLHGLDRIRTRSSLLIIKKVSWTVSSDLKTLQENASDGQRVPTVGWNADYKRYGCLLNEAGWCSNDKFK